MGGGARRAAQRPGKTDPRRLTLLEAPATALQEESLAGDAEHLGGFLHASLRAIERGLHHHPFEILHGLRQRLVEADAELRLRGRGGRDRAVNTSLLDSAEIDPVFETFLATVEIVSPPGL